MADAAHQALLHQKQHQAIVISGESGAGKTESANLLLKQLVFLSKVIIIKLIQFRTHNYNLSLFNMYFIDSKWKFRRKNFASKPNHGSIR